MPHFDKKYFSDDHSLNNLPSDIQPFNALKGKKALKLKSKLGQTTLVDIIASVSPKKILKQATKQARGRFCPFLWGGNKPTLWM